MIVARLLIIFFCLLVMSACNKEIVRENQPLDENKGISDIAKTDIDNVIDVHIRESRSMLKELMVKLYKRNPRELEKSELKLPREHIVRLFDLKHAWDFPELQGRHDIETIKLTFTEEFHGDRVFSFIAGLMEMIMKAYNYKSEYFLFDSMEPQKLYNAARNIEIAVWKLKNNRDSKGELFLYSNSTDEDEVSNLSYERLFGKLIATQDNMALVMAGKKNRTIKSVIQKMATAIFLPI